jgi:hypothetical protein
MRVLSKSRFKLGLECPNNLHFTNVKAFIERNIHFVLNVFL